MSKQTEALKLALEALREIERLPGISSANLYARRALREIEALAEQPAQEPICDDDVCVDCGMEHCECGEKDD
jgi:hypothetical protein